ncbi:MAG: heat-inducible transcriptional repressor HrcA [Cellvibrionales bacterium]|jgi:heat-inducible transcriptional repressor
MSDNGLSTRATDLLRTLVEMHIRDGQPVGSKSLQACSALAVSPATIRNTMSDLEERGFLTSPHTSAGRIPTAQGYRFFVDSLLKVQPMEEQAVLALREELHPNRTAKDLVQSASHLLAQVTSQAGIVTVPRAEVNQLRQVEFLPLSENRVLVILVVNEREVQNRVIELPTPLSESQLKAAADLINQRYAGADLAEVKQRLIQEMDEARSRIDAYMATALELANRALDADESGDDYVVAGENYLLGQASPDDMDKLRELFDAFQHKRDLLELLERSSRAQGVQIFIGEEAGYDVFGDYSVITAPYTQGNRTLGVLGVIGPTRMAYERVIPMVDVTAKMLSAALSR